MNILVNIACQFWRNIPLWLFPRKGKVLWVAFIEAGVAHCCASVVRPPPLGEQLDIGLGFVFKQLNTFDKKKHWKQYLPPLRWNLQPVSSCSMSSGLIWDLGTTSFTFRNCLLAVKPFEKNWEHCRAVANENYRFVRPTLFGTFSVQNLFKPQRV